MSKIDSEKKQEIRERLSLAINRYLTPHRNRPLDNQHVLDLIFPNERRIASIILGLQTSFGTTLWETTAKALLVTNGFDLVEKSILRPSVMPAELSNKIEELQERRLTTDTNLKECAEEIRDKCKVINYQGTYEAPPPGSGIDVWAVKHGTEYAFDIKTNQVNQNGGKTLNRQLLEWYAYRFTADPSCSFEARIAFPFNPYKKKSWWKAQGSSVFPLKQSEDAWVENEFWDFCSGGDDTWSEILNVFEELGRDGFGQQFTDVFNLPE